MRKSLRNLMAVLALGLTVLSPIAAEAHAVVVKAQPALDQQVAAGPLAIRLEFNSRIDKERSKLELTAPDGGKTEIPLAQDGEPNVVTATTAALAAGAYSLRWQVLAVDGHITRGDIPFTVGP
ncbi:MAG TPA: copper resistance CopC family protein [Dongiaceae bacterium]|nr:copper resistance CopC family protein [Dongiaceae bacterium]